MSQIFLFSGIILWVITIIKNKEKIRFPTFFWWLICYSLFTLLSALFSKYRLLSIIDSREIFLYLSVPLLYMGIKSLRDIEFVKNAFLISALISSSYSIMYYILKAEPGERVRGFMGHYMTQAGLMLLVICFSLSLFFYSKRKNKILWLIVFLFSIMALLLTLTRSSWVGVFFAFAFILYHYKPKTLVILPLIVVLFFLLAPNTMKQRALSIFSLKDKSNLDRIYLAKSGLKIVRDYPLLGIGPATFPLIYENYKLPQAERKGIHLHNNLLQIAVERGIFAMLSWLGFILFTFISLYRMLGYHDLKPYSLGALGAIVGLFIAGLFEYNFGDSEIKMLFLFLITLPFCYKSFLE
ncbi:O-antigen ligase family protein [SCandidatus Aminicenantes bacterium Aminicenantia_JdfR_composite]|nr:O-antigen ligase family protein [SCandidatus Aminicenantes bacterium Aminicenantia_JdfR_composite]